jgi:hypothetical protein
MNSPLMMCILVFLLLSPHLGLAQGRKQNGLKTDSIRSGIVLRDVNLRNGPDVKYRPRRKITSGTEVIITECDSAWCNIRIGSQKGYVPRSALRFSMEEPDNKGSVLSRFIEWLWVMIMCLLPIFGVTLLVRAHKLNRVSITPRGYAFLLVAIVLLPLLRVTAWLVGEDAILSLTAFQLAVSGFNIADFVCLVLLIGKAITYRHLPSGVIAVIVLALAGAGTYFDAIGGLCVNIMAALISIDEIILEGLDPTRWHGLVDRFMVRLMH